MVKRKTESLETIDEVIENLKSAETEIINVINEEEPSPKSEEKEDVDKIREELIHLSEDGEITQSVAAIRKASKRTIERINADYNRKRAAKANKFLTDLIISKWADVLGGLDAIESSEALTKELEKDQLLRKDVLTAVEMITPYVPFLGLLSGGVITAKHVYNHKAAPAAKEDESTSSPS